jgi:hypothetical protein
LAQSHAIADWAVDRDQRVPAAAAPKASSPIKKLKMSRNIQVIDGLIVRPEAPA